MSEQRINDGGSAFPHETSHGYDSGMSIRDYFAAAALQGLMAEYDPEDELEHHIAKWSYKAADAMLKARGCK
jgi:hypothetical protein